MRRSLQLAAQASGYTSPNPMVGATLVYNDRIIGEGFHHAYGRHHAEVDCLLNVAEEDRQWIPESTMYVTLEPCAHYGLTPPCALLLVRERVNRVVIANTDPFVQVSGKGIAILQEAGIEIETGMLAAEGLWLNRRFFCFHTQYRPYIVLKWAQTSDGYIAPADKNRYQITGNLAQQLVHKWRTEEAAILVGATTALNDNPQLTARLWHGRQPLRIVLDRNLQLPPSHAVFDAAAETWIVNELKEEQKGNVRYVQLAFDRTLIASLIQQLHIAKKLSLIVEGGAKLLNSFIEHGLWDEARIFTGSQTLGGGLPAPLLTNAAIAFETTIGCDRLNVLVNKHSSYRYVAGMGL